MRDIAALQLFVRVARLGSFSAAARELGMSQPQVSRIIAELEQHLGGRLLTRTTRAVVLTETGADFLARLEPVLYELDEAEQAVRGGQELRGQLRVSMPSSIGVRELIPRMSAFATRHPSLRIHVQLEDRRQDLIRDGVDVAVRVGKLVDSTATTRTIGHIRRVFVASPAYLERTGVPMTPGDLSQHRIIEGPASVVPGAWAAGMGDARNAPTLSAHITTNENEGALAFALAGLGVATVSEWTCRAELASGALVEVFANLETAPLPVHFYFPMGRATRAAGRAFADHLQAALAADGLIAA